MVDKEISITNGKEKISSYMFCLYNIKLSESITIFD